MPARDVARTPVRPDAGRRRPEQRCEAAPGWAAPPLVRLRGMFLLLALLFLTACGLPGDDSVDRVAVSPGPPSPERTGLAPDGRTIAVWFVRGSRLEAVSRSADEPGPSGALALLLAGPTRAEVVDGLRTALSPVDLAVPPGADGTGTVTIAVGRDFADIGGGNQLLAVAQVVWTATQFRSVDLVCFTLDGVLVEVPTDTGLIDRPVGRSDYPSVAPPPARGENTERAAPSGSRAPERASTGPPGTLTAACPAP